ncbi:PPOX class F420-dependent oxidoreductase [Saccharomonospora sp. NPDC006951]
MTGPTNPATPTPDTSTPTSPAPPVPAPTSLTSATRATRAPETRAPETPTPETQAWAGGAAPRLVAVVAGLVLLAGGFWALFAPASFADFVGFPAHTHFSHDLGAFQLGIGITLMLATIWGDALAVALAGFAVGGTVHLINHIVDLDEGGSVWQLVLLALLSAATMAGLALRLRALGFVTGVVTIAATPELAPLVRQKTISLTTYRKDGRQGSSPVSIAVDGDKAYLRSFEKSLKTRRVARDSRVEVTRSNGSGRALTGPPLQGNLRRLTGAEYRYAARQLRRKYPILHGVIVPLVHRLGRSKTGRTVHFELTLR